MSDKLKEINYGMFIFVLEPGVWRETRNCSVPNRKTLRRWLKRPRALVAAIAGICNRWAISQW